MTEIPYFVVGGTYTDTRFEEIAPSSHEERLGPFHDYAQAREVWAEHAWRTVDDCHARYRIVDANGIPVSDPPDRS